MHSFWEVSRNFPARGKFVLNTVDTIFRQEDFRRYVDEFAASDDADGYMAVTSFIDDEKPLYIDVNDDMRITAFLDAPHEGVKYISGGIYGLTQPALGILDDCMKTVSYTHLDVYKRQRAATDTLAAGMMLKREHSRM